MKKITGITGFLSWFNLVVSSILVLGGLLSGLVAGSMLSTLTSVVLIAAIILHSYAALQLRRSILHPEIPLGNQTPVGIRFIGYVALFFAFLNIVNSILLLQHTSDFVQQLKLPPEAKNIDVNKVLKGAGIFALLFSIAIMVNVVLNYRLLKRYLYERDKNDE